MGRRLLGAFLVCALVLAVAPEVCLACSCIVPEPQVALAQSPLVFRGRLVGGAASVARTYRNDGTFKEYKVYRADFLVSTVWKGDVLPIMSVYNGREDIFSTCDYYFGGSPGATAPSSREYLIFASGGGGVGVPDWPSTYWCAGTRSVEDGDPFLASLGPGKGLDNPIPAASGLGSGLASSASRLAVTATYAGRANMLDHPPGRAATTAHQFGFTPVGLTLDRDGNRYVIDLDQLATNVARVVKIAPDGQILQTWGTTSGVGSNQFGEPNLLAVDSKGQVWVSDLSRLWTLGSDGSMRRRLEPGFSPFYAQGLAIDTQDNIYLSNGVAKLIVKVSPDGRELARWNVGGGVITADRQGNLYLADTGISKIAPNGTILGRWDYPKVAETWFYGLSGIAADASGNIYVADRGNLVRQFSPDGILVAEWRGTGVAPGQFGGTMGVAVDARGDVYVADRGNFRIQRIPAAGAP